MKSKPEPPATDLMLAIFFGHGKPMNALSRNVYTDFRYRGLTAAPSPCLLSR